MSDNPVVHFEMPYEDADRVQKFYQTAFGWGTQLLPGEEMGNYITAQTAETDDDMMVQTPGSINGGFYLKKPDLPAQFPNVVIAVKDIQRAVADIKQAGGEVLGEPVAIPGIGTYVSFNDSEGNRVSVLQAESEES